MGGPLGPPILFGAASPRNKHYQCYVVPLSPTDTLAAALED